MAVGQGNKFVSNVYGIDKKVDSLPCFIYEKAELDTFLFNNQIIPPEEEQWGINFYVDVSFFLDTLGKPNKIVISKVNARINRETTVKDHDHMDSLQVYFCKESARLIMLTEGMWLVNSKTCNNKINMMIPFETEEYDAKNIKALEPKWANERAFEYWPQNTGEIKTSKNIYRYYDFGVKKLSENKLLIAKKYFQQALKIKKDDIDALYNLGICYVKLNDYDNACKLWKTGQSYGDSGVDDLIKKYCK
ncbi:MAG: tetratricopeptide repeat protein [Bacteroidia bacterium]